jgi:hypothetical protein
VTHHHNQVQFALVQTPNGDAILNVDDISHVVPYEGVDAHPAFGGGENVRGGMRIHFKTKGGTYLDLPGITATGLAGALNGAPF